MAGRRINILGASGSGTSTLGRTVASALALPFFDSDDYYHAPSDPPFRNPRAPVERCAMLERDVGAAGASWVLAGGVALWDPMPALDFTLLVFLWAPVEVREQRLRRRERERFGDRILPRGDMHEDHEAFITWASRYDAGDIEGKTLARHEAYLASAPCPVLDLRGVETTREALGAVLSHPSMHRL